MKNLQKELAASLSKSHLKARHFKSNARSTASTKSGKGKATAGQDYYDNAYAVDVSDIMEALKSTFNVKKFVPVTGAKGIYFGTYHTIPSDKAAVSAFVNELQSSAVFYTPSVKTYYLTAKGSSEVMGAQFDIDFSDSDGGIVLSVDVTVNFRSGFVVVLGI